MPRSLRLTWLLLVLAASAGSDAATIEHDGVACVVTGKFPLLQARIGPVDRLARARAFFRADDDPRWYYVEMKPEQGAFHGVLPQPLKTTKRVHYYIEATDKDVTQNRTQEYAAEVVPDAAGCGNKGMVAGIAAVSKVVVGAPAGVSAAPAGFASNSLAVAGATGGGLGATTLVVAGIAVAGGAAAAVVASSSGDEGDGSQGSSGDNRLVTVGGTVYSDPCCSAGIVDSNPAARSGSRRIAGATVSTLLDSATTTTDAQGAFRLNTQTRCQSTTTFTLRIVASGCDPLSVDRNWGCVSDPSLYALNLICR